MKLFLDTEPYKTCFHIEGNLEDENTLLVNKILTNNFEEFIPDDEFLDNHIEIGPRRNFKTSWNSNVCQIFKRCGITNLESIEFTKFYPKDYTNYDNILYEKYKEFPRLENKEICFVVNDITEFNREQKLGLDDQDIDYYEDIFSNLGRNPTNIELFDLSQCNSEHARHWFFNGIFQLKGKNLDELSLLDLLKTTKNNNSNSLVSFKDNASVILGTMETNHIIEDNRLVTKQKFLNYSYKAETHNFPTGIAPFPGAATGVGGRMRDNVCVGIGGNLIAGTAGYCVGDIDLEYSNQLNSPKKILIEASNGASDYGNKVGEPLIQGFTRSYREDFDQGRIEWLKPIMFSGGIGKLIDTNINKRQGNVGDLIVRIGGPAYNIGMGGGSASSRSQEEKNLDDDLKAVQRGDPEMANKVFRFVESCCKNEPNPIISIHDQGSGGMANVTREISEPMGAKIFLDKVVVGDKTMNSLEKWIAEYQEQITILIKPISLNLVETIAKVENVPLTVVGYIDNEKILEVYSDEDENTIVKLPVLNNNFTKTFPIEKPIQKYSYSPTKINTSIIQKLEKVFRHVSVSSKGYLVNKVDRSVGGLVVQQQCVGPYQLPLSNYSLVKNEFLSDCGLVSSIGEKPINGLYDLESMVDMTVSEMLTNMIWGNIQDIDKINSVANWMWSSTEPKEAYKLRKALHILVDRVNQVGFSINGGKDSLSMNVKVEGVTIKSPNTLVLSGYTNTLNYRKRVTPYLKSTNSKILLLKINNKNRLGGSILQEVMGMDTNLNCPRIDCWKKFKNILESVQELISNEFILSGHDKSDGGLLTTLIEMSISSGIGLNLEGSWEYLFNEEMGLVIEISQANLSNVKKILKKRNVLYDIIGGTNNSNLIKIFKGEKIIFNEKINYLRYLWSSRSLELEKEQNNIECIEQERKALLFGGELNYIIDESIYRRLSKFNINFKKEFHKKVAILRDEGSNGDREMGVAFYNAGFNVYNLSMEDLISGKESLKDFAGVAFVGGFSYSDVLGAGVGWKSVIENNSILKKEFDDFYKRFDTFSLGVCNGCQVMSNLGYLGGDIKLVENKSGKFESRFNLVKIEKSNSVFLSGMEGMTMGIWSSHGEGRMVGHSEFTPIKYVSPEGDPTEMYPYNPNGSKNGICAFSSACGRHLAMMPHPERCFLTSQIPYLDKSHELFRHTFSPWALMFKNVYEWCISTTYV